jgi:hypothetical protein
MGTKYKQLINSQDNIKVSSNFTFFKPLKLISLENFIDAINIDKNKIEATMPSIDQAQARLLPNGNGLIIINAQ